MADKDQIGTGAMNGEYYAVQCDQCGKRSRDADKLGDTHDSIFCKDNGQWVEYE